MEEYDTHSVPSAVLVAPDELGAINATLLSLEALTSRGARICGVILNRSEGLDFGNRQAIERFGCAPFLGTLPRLEGASDDELGCAAEANLELDTLFGAP